MIQINLRTNSVRKTVTAEVTTTPKAIFENEGLSVANAMVNLDGQILSASDLNAPISTLGIADGSGNHHLSAIIKADGAK